MASYVKEKSKWRKFKTELVFDYGQVKIRLGEGEVVGGDWEFRPVNPYKPIDQNKEAFVEIKMIFKCPTKKISLETKGD